MVTYTIIPTPERIYPESFNIQAEVTANREIYIELDLVIIFYLAWVSWCFLIIRRRKKQHYNSKSLRLNSATNPSMERTKLHSYS